LNCLINDMIDVYLQKGKKVEAIRKYLQEKYRITMDTTSIQERVRLLQLKYKMRKA